MQPIEEIGRIAAEADVYFHTDAVQAAGKVPLNVEALGCDLLSISGHKLHAPQGVGALYVRKGTKLQAMMYGGRHERSRRAGTENVPGIVGFGKAAEIALARMTRGESTHGGHARSTAASPLESRKCRCEWRRCAARARRRSSIYFDGIDGEALVIALDLKGTGRFHRCGLLVRSD